jgi:hypothetical protein
MIEITTNNNLTNKFLYLNECRCDNDVNDQNFNRNNDEL